MWDERTISVVVPSYKRPGDLRAALASVTEQNLARGPGGFRLEIVVVDNDARASARGVAADAVRALPEGMALHYCVEPRSGLVWARNRGLAEARGRYVFFLDDDMVAQPDCVALLMGALGSHGAGVAFAAVDAVMPEDGDADLMARMQPFFSRRPDMAEGPVEIGFGAGGALFDRVVCELPVEAFDPRANVTGGEDDVLLNGLLDRGVRFAWVPSAVTRETVPAHRATLDYLWTRNFAYGQGPTEAANDRGSRAGVMKWMAVGAAQAVLRLPGWALLHAVGHPGRASAHARMAQALGKVFWRKRAALYGAGGAALQRAPA